MMQKKNVNIFKVFFKVLVTFILYFRSASSWRFLRQYDTVRKAAILAELLTRKVISWVFTVVDKIWTNYKPFNLKQTKKRRFSKPIRYFWCILMKHPFGIFPKIQQHQRYTPSSLAEPRFSFTLFHKCINQWSDIRYFCLLKNLSTFLLPSHSSFCHDIF